MEYRGCKSQAPIGVIIPMRYFMVSLLLFGLTVLQQQALEVATHLMFGLTVLQQPALEVATHLMLETISCDTNRSFSVFNNGCNLF